MTPARITQAEFARRHNVSRQAIGDLVTRGIVELDPANLLDEAQALASIAASRDPARAGRIISGPELPEVPTTAQQATEQGQGDLPSTEEATSYHAAKTRRERAEANMAELKLAEKVGQLVRMDQLEPELTRMFAAFRSVVMQMPSSIKADLDTLYGIDIDQQLLQDRFNDALEQLAGYQPHRGGADRPAGELRAPTPADDHHAMGP